MLKEHSLSRLENRVSIQFIDRIYNVVILSAKRLGLAMSMSTSMPTLPVELLKQIVQDSTLDRSDLYNLCLASRLLFYEASPVLYHTVTLQGARSTKLAVQTFISSPRVAQLVQVLATRSDPDFFDFGEVTSQLNDAISNMANLKELRLFYLWTASPFHESNQGPAGHGWTRSLNLSPIQTLGLSTSLTRPLSDLFGVLPVPLPRLDINRPVQVRWVQGVRHLRCERIYGNPISPLLDLNHLEVANIESFPVDNPDWAPNLESMAITAHPDYVQTCHWMRWARLSPMLKTLRKIGPVGCTDANDFKSFVAFITDFENLEFILLLLPATPYRNFGDLGLGEVLKRFPKLKKIVVAALDGPSAPFTIRRISSWDHHIPPVERDHIGPGTLQVDWVQSSISLGWDRAFKELLGLM